MQTQETNLMAPILIADPDLDYIAKLRMDPNIKGKPPVFATTQKDVALHLCSPDSNFSAIFLSPEFEAPLSVSLVRLALKNFPAIPLFFLTSNQKLTTPSEAIDKLNIRKVVLKPASYLDLVRMTHMHKNAFNASVAVKQASKNSDVLGQNSASTDAEFVAIRAQQFLSGSTSFFDLYVRLAQDRYLKILQAGDAFDSSRVKQYLDKGVKDFFLRKESQEDYLKYCDHLAAAMVKKASFPLASKANIVLNQGEETMSFLRNNGIKEEGIIYAKHYATNVIELVDKLRPERSRFLSSLLADAVTYEHSVAATLIGSLLMKQMDFHSEKSIFTIGLGCFLHDIGLQDMPAHFKEETEAAMKPEELVLYRQHPRIGAAMLAGLGGIEPAVIQAIEQHHERRDRSGFPNQTSSAGINRIAEIIGISDEFISLMKRSAADPKVNPFLEMEQRVFSGFSLPVVEAFRKVFMK